jgi:hypothetical protein
VQLRRGAGAAWDKAADHFEKNPDDDRSSRTIGAEIGVSRATVNQAKKAAVKCFTTEPDDRPTIDNPPKGPAP